MNQAIVALIGLPGWAEIAIIALLAMLLFARRLPVVARAIGQTFVEFRRGFSGDKTAD